MTLSMQVLGLLSMLVCGFIIGILWETYCRITKFLEKYVIISGVLDVIFWLGQAVFVFALIFHLNDGHLRLYLFICLILGWFIYIKKVRSLYQDILEYIVTVCVKISQVIWFLLYRIIISPLLAIIHGCLAVLLFLLKPFRIALFGKLIPFIKHFLRKIQKFFDK